MKNLKFILLIIMSIAMITTLSACSSSGSEEKTEVDTDAGQQKQQEPLANSMDESVVEEEDQQKENNVEVDNPEAAIEEIYSEITINGIEDIDEEILTDKFEINMDDVDQYWAKYSAKNYGVSDMFIIKPIEGSEENIEEAFESIKKIRIEEFTNYDVYNSLEITKKSVIYTQGDYIIMLMLEDNNRAKEIINKYIAA